MPHFGIWGTNSPSPPLTLSLPIACDKLPFVVKVGGIAGSMQVKAQPVRQHFFVPLQFVSRKHSKLTVLAVQSPISSSDIVFAGHFPGLNPDIGACSATKETQP